MKVLILSALGVATLVIAPALAQSVPPMQHHRAAPSTRADVQAHVATMFARLDVNRDGYLTTAELDARKAEHAGKRQANAEQRGARAFERFDANKDGQISRQEWDQGRAMRQQHAGMGKKAMRRAGMGGGMGMRMFTRADANNDGRVTLAEAQQAAVQRFDRADANRDGTITPDERRQMREQMRAQRQRG